MEAFPFFLNHSSSTIHPAVHSGYNCIRDAIITGLYLTKTRWGMDGDVGLEVIVGLGCTIRAGAKTIRSEAAWRVWVGCGGLMALPGEWGCGGEMETGRQQRRERGGRYKWRRSSPGEDAEGQEEEVEWER